MPIFKFPIICSYSLNCFHMFTMFTINPMLCQDFPWAGESIWTVLMFARTILDSQRTFFIFLESLAHREWGATHSRIKSPRQKLLLRDATTTKNVLVLVARPENVKPLSKVQCSQAILVTLPVKNATVGNIWCFKVNEMFPLICYNIQILKNLSRNHPAYCPQ